MTPRMRTRRILTGATTRFVLHHWASHPRYLAWIVLAFLGATGAELTLPLFAGRLVDSLMLPDRDTATPLVLRLTAIIALLGIVSVVLRWLGLRGINTMTSAVMTRMAGSAFERVQRFSTDWHVNNFAGSTVRSITRGMWAYDRLSDTVLLAMIPALAALAGAAIVLGSFWPELGLVMLIAALSFIGMTVSLTLGWVMPAASLANSWDTRISGVLADAMSCNATVKAFGAEASEEQRFGSLLGKWRGRTVRFWNRAIVAASLQNLGLLALQLAIIVTALWLWWQGRASPGDITYVMTTSWLISGYLRDIGQHVHNAQQALNEMEELAVIERTQPGIADRPGAGPIRIDRGRIVCDKVTFHYAGHAEPLYRDFDLVIEGGSKVGLVGRSGSGKTTFVKLLQRLYDIDAGCIAIDGADIAAVTQASLRSQIAVVPQEPALFHRSLLENIAYARPGASMGEIERAARAAYAHEFIMQLPKGYATLVGERGVKLSGGERQRVALARAFLADAPILVLDEATSSLDSMSEALIQDATLRLMQGRTALVIAHRLATICSMDRILVFERGRIIEDDDHDALLRRADGLFRRLHDQQMGARATV